MMSAKGSAVMGVIVVGVFAVLIGKMLLSEPHCKGGCRTLAEHLVEHGIKNIIRGFLA